MGPDKEAAKNQPNSQCTTFQFQFTAFVSRTISKCIRCTLLYKMPCNFYSLHIFVGFNLNHRFSVKCTHRYSILLPYNFNEAKNFFAQTISFFQIHFQNTTNTGNNNNIAPWMKPEAAASNPFLS